MFMAFHSTTRRKSMLVALALSLLFLGIGLWLRLG